MCDQGQEFRVAGYLRGWITTGLVLCEKQKIKEVST